MQSSSRFPAYSFFPIELKFGRMVVDIGLHNCLEPDFSIFPKRYRGGVPLEIFKSSVPKNYISYPTELTLGRMMLDISLHNRCE